MNDDNKSLTFTLPEVPIMLQSPEDRLNFMVQHYWDHFNFKDTAYIHVPDITEQALVDYMDLLNRVPSSLSDSCLIRIMQQASQEKKMFGYFVEIFRRYLFDPNSPLRNEELYEPVCRFLSASSLTDEAARSRAQPPRNLDYNSTNLPWRVQADIAGGGYFYDLAPHQLDLLQDMFGCILEAQGYKSNRGGLYPAEDTISACFKFDSGLPGSGSWCFVAHESAKEDRIEIIGDKGMICFSVFTYDPIALHTERGREEFLPENPPHVQLPLIKAVVEHLQGKAVCTCDGISATPTNWVMDRILNKL